MMKLWEKLWNDALLYEGRNHHAEAEILKATAKLYMHGSDLATWYVVLKRGDLAKPNGD